MNGRKTGTFGDLNSFSFFSHDISTMEGLPGQTVTVDALLRALKSDTPDDLSTGDLSDIPAGLVHWHEGEVRRIRPAPLVEDLDRDQPASSWDLLPMEEYRAHNWQCFGDLGARRPYASIHTTLGCPYTCSFRCISAPFGRNGYRFRSPEAVLREIDLLIEQYGVRAGWRLKVRADSRRTRAGWGAGNRR